MREVRASDVFGNPGYWMKKILAERGEYETKDETEMDDFLETNWVKNEGKNEQ